MFYIKKFVFGDAPSENELFEKKTGEQLETQLIDDWVVVHPCDKENSGQSTPSTLSQNNYNHHHHPHHHSPKHYNPYHAVACHSQVSGEHDNLSQGSGCAGATDEFLDDADSLVNSLCGCGPVSHMSPLHDCGNVNYDMDSDCSSDAESTPESVFSASSGRSHATYHPRGNKSEPWVVAPAPCFTGSQAGETNTVWNSPMENLLIEHPSMSVYLSLPQSCRSMTHQLPSSIHLTGEDHRGALEDLQEPSVNVAPSDVELPAQEQNGGSVVQARSRLVQAVFSPGLVSPEQLMKKVLSSQRSLCRKSQKNINSRKCELQNKVREQQGQSKSNNCRNKRLRPSGFRSSRFTQRM